MYTAANPAAERVAESPSTKLKVAIERPKRAKNPIVSQKTGVDTEKVNPNQKKWMIRLRGGRKLCHQ